MSQGHQREKTPSRKRFDLPPYEVQTGFQYDNPLYSAGLTIGVHDREVVALKTAIAIARAICTSRSAQRILALALEPEWEDVYGDIPAPVMTIQGEPRPDLLSYVREWFEGDNTEIVIDRSLKEGVDGECDPHDPKYIMLNESRITAAARAYEFPLYGKNPEARYRMHIVHLAVIIMHEYQHSCRYSLREKTEIAPPRVRPPGTQTMAVDRKHPEGLRRGEGGFLFEHEVLGGRLVRTAPVGQELYKGQIESLVLYTRHIEDWVLMDSDVIRVLYNAPQSDDWKEYLPVKPSSRNQIRPGAHPKAYRRLNVDGSDAIRVERQLVMMGIGCSIKAVNPGEISTNSNDETPR